MTGREQYLVACHRCDRRAVERLDGTLRVHGPRARRCPGSGQPSSETRLMGPPRPPATGTARATEQDRLRAVGERIADVLNDHFAREIAPRLAGDNPRRETP